jgi:hypothetical protein
LHWPAPTAVGDASFMHGPPYRSPTLLAKVVTAAYVPLIAGGLYAIATLVGGMSGSGDDRYLTSLHSLDVTLSALQIVGGLAFFAWLHRAASNLPAFGETAGSPGMTVACFFIPVLNLWKPYGAVGNLWLASDPALRGDDPDRWNGVRVRTPFFILAWWIASLISHGKVRLSHTVVEATPADWVAAHGAVIGLVAIKLVAVALTLAVVWSITHRQEARATGIPGLASARVVR